MTHGLRRTLLAAPTLYSVWLLVIGAAAGCAVVQRPDPSFRVSIPDPDFTASQGPVVWIDQGHNNIVHTRSSSRYGPFLAALRADGYAVRPFNARFTKVALSPVQLLVIGNALHDRNVKDWSLPTPSAFTADEILALHSWVGAGGALLLLVDHMPIAGAAVDLGAAFGIEFLNGLVEDPSRWDPAVFRRDNGMLLDHPITRDARGVGALQRVATFDGAAFRAPGADPLMVLGSEYVSYQTRIAWKIDADTPQIPVSGWLQGAVRLVGRGRLAVFGDATMFSAQIAPGGSRLGMNTPEGSENLQLLRNVLRWLRSRSD